MNRINVFEHPPAGDFSEAKLVGHFDFDKAEEWSDRDHDNNGSGGTGRGQAVIRTAGGLWVLRRWTIWQDQTDGFEFISDDQAQEWLLRNNFDDAVTEYFGEIEEERGPGRSRIGDRLTVRFPPDVRAKIKAYAGEHNTSESGAVRDIVANVLTN